MTDYPTTPAEPEAASAPQAEPERVQFGERDDDSMPVAWASRGLTWLREKRPAVFVDMMTAIVGVEVPQAARRGRPAKNPADGQ